MLHTKCGCGGETSFVVCGNGHVQKVYEGEECTSCKSETLNAVCLSCVKIQENEAEERLREYLSKDQAVLFEAYRAAARRFTSMMILD
jgi:hypothetical protein